MQVETRHKGRHKSTTCRFCGLGAEKAKLVHGAHVSCKRANDKKTTPREPGPCKRCGVAERSLKSSRGFCVSCSFNFKEESRRLANAKYRKKLKEARPVRLCACGCGRPCTDRTRWLYATDKCAETMESQKRNARQRAKRAEQAKAERKYTQYRPAKKVQDRPYAESREAVAQAEPPRPVDVRGHTVTRVPSFGRPGLRNLFGDDQGRTWSAAD